MSYTLALFILYSLVFVFGAVIGSFLNVVIYRLPLGISVAKGRSFCPNCHKTLKPHHMVPILSWFFLKGRCGFCKEPISKRYPLVEALGGLVALLPFVAMGFTAHSLVAAAAGLVFLALAFVDWDTMTVPYSLLIALAITAIAGIFSNPGFSWVSSLIGVFAVSLPLLIITIIVPGAFGGGDILFMAVVGFLLGWQLILVGAFLGIVFGGAYGVCLLLRSKENRKKHFPFLPFLAAGVYIALLWGQDILNWYLSWF